MASFSSSLTMGGRQLHSKFRWSRSSSAEAQPCPHSGQLTSVDGATRARLGSTSSSRGNSASIASLERGGGLSVGASPTFECALEMVVSTTESEEARQGMSSEEDEVDLEGSGGVRRGRFSDADSSAIGSSSSSVDEVDALSAACGGCRDGCRGGDCGGCCASGAGCAGTGCAGTG